MPSEWRDLIGSIIAEKANWTNEEIIVWLDNRRGMRRRSIPGLKQSL